MLEFHRRQLQINRATGAADNSEAVLGEALNMIGYSWLAQRSASATAIDRLVGTKSVVLCAVGVAAQVGGPYLDLPGIFLGVSSLTNDLNRVDTAFYTGVGMGSALEWGTLAQDLSKVGVGAVSTVKLLDIANTQHDVIFDATSANWTGTVQPQLVGYAPGDISAIQGYINAGYRIILPKRGNLTEGMWTGMGYIGVGTSGAGLQQIVYGISSNLKGGYSTFNTEPQFYVPELMYIAEPVPPPPQVVSLDPIDLSSGAFLYDHDDLSIGSGNLPYGLAFRRSYNSNNLYAKGTLGAGWSHGFAISAAANSDGLKGLGQDSPIDGAAALAAMHVAQALFSDASKPFDKFLIATLVQKWLMDRLINNTVNVTTGAQGEQFMLLADGSYNPQLGSSSRLILKDGLYSLQYKEGTTLHFNSDGNISSWQVPTGLNVSFAYDASSPPLLTSVSNSIGRSLSLSYNGTRQLISVADSAWPPRSVAYTYDAAGNLGSFSDPLGDTTTFAYTPAAGGFPQGLLSQIFYPSNPTTPFVTNAYDTLGRVAAQTNANGATWNYFFAGYRSEEDDPQGTQHVLYYNPRGKALFDIQDAAGLNLQTRFTYDGLDRLSATVLPGGLATSYTYAAAPNPWANNVATVTRSAASGPLTPTVTSYAYEANFNKPARITDALGRVTLVEYDPWTGNPLVMTADAGAAPHFNVRTTFSYNELGLLASTTDPLGVVTRHSYDGFGNRVSTVADAGTGRLNLSTTSTYDARGDPLSVTDPRGNVTTSTYDAARRPVTTTTPATPGAPGGVTTTNTYDPVGQVIQVQQSTGGSVLRTTSATYTPTGKQATTTDANGNVTRFGYDTLDRLSSVTDAAGRRTTYAYDAVSRRTGTFNPAIQAAALLAQTYTVNGKVATLADANGNATSFAYDGFDRLATATYPGGSTATFTYDALDNVLTRKTRANTTITLTYDTLNRLATKTVPSGPVVTYSYDRAGRLKSASDTSAAMPSVATPVSTTTYATSFTYDALNRPTAVTFDPVAAATPPTAGTLVTFGHSYNAVNQRVGQTVSDNTWLAYPAGAPATTAYTANALNQYTAVGAASPTYDGNGNLTNNGTYAYTYDAESRLASATLGGNTATYQYDAQGRRKARTSGGTTTLFVTDADNREVLEYNGSTGAVLRWYAYGLGPNDVLGQINVPAGTRTMPIPDILGSIVGSVDASTGAVTKFGYLPYGGGTPANPFGFTGQRFDAEAGLYYYRARHYSTAYGRFLQTDPIGYEGGINLYSYVNNSPVGLGIAIGIVGGVIAGGI